MIGEELMATPKRLDALASKISTAEHTKQWANARKTKNEK